MEVKFALNTSVGIKDIGSIINQVENEVKALIDGKDYGPGLLEIYLGWICVAPEYEQFFKPRKPKFYENKEMSVDGRKYTLSRDKVRL